MQFFPDTDDGITKHHGKVQGELFYHKYLKLAELNTRIYRNILSTVLRVIIYYLSLQLSTVQ